MTLEDQTLKVLSSFGFKKIDKMVLSVNITIISLSGKLKVTLIIILNEYRCISNPALNRQFERTEPSVDILEITCNWKKR